MSETVVNQAVKQGERTLRRAVRKGQRAREEMANALKFSCAEIEAEVLKKLEAEIHQLDQIIEFGTRALSTLPESPQERLKTLSGALATLSDLAADAEVRLHE